MTASSAEWAVGTVLGSLTPPAISRTTLALFAGASGDHNPMHIDLDFARAAGREDVFAHGMLSMAYLGRVLTSLVDVRSIRTFSTRFVSITPVGAELTCSATVAELIDADAPQARLELTATTADGVVVSRGEAIVDRPV